MDGPELATSERVLRKVGRLDERDELFGAAVAKPLPNRRAVLRHRRVALGRTLQLARPIEATLATIAAHVVGHGPLVDRGIRRLARERYEGQ